MEPINTRNISLLRYYFAIYTSLHLIIIYLYQTEYLQKQLNPETFTARILGLRKMILHGNCNSLEYRSWDVTVNKELTPQGKWPCFLQPFLLFVVHVCCSNSLRIFDKYDKLKTKLDNIEQKAAEKNKSNNKENINFTSVKENLNPGPNNSEVELNLPDPVNQITTTLPILKQHNSMPPAKFNNLPNHKNSSNTSPYKYVNKLPPIESPLILNDPNQVAIDIDQVDSGAAGTAGIPNNFVPKSVSYTNNLNHLNQGMNKKANSLGQSREFKQPALPSIPAHKYHTYSNKPTTKLKHVDSNFRKTTDYTCINSNHHPKSQHHHQPPRLHNSQTENVLNAKTKDLVFKEPNTHHHTQYNNFSNNNLNRQKIGRSKSEVTCSMPNSRHNSMSNHYNKQKSSTTENNNNNNKDLIDLNPINFIARFGVEKILENLMDNQWNNDYKQKLDNIKEQSAGKVVAIFTFVRTKALWIIGLVTMMSWSAAYHSLLTLVLLIWAVYLWTVQDREVRTLKHSLWLVRYSILLVAGQVLYSFDLYENEIPECIRFPSFKNKHNLTDLLNSNFTCEVSSNSGGVGYTQCKDGCQPVKVFGFERYESSAMTFGNLATKICFTTIFILMLKEQKRLDLREKHKQDGTLDKNAVDAEEEALTELLKGPIGEVWDWISKNASKYWIIILFTFQLTIGLTGKVEFYKILYIIIFLLQTLLFQVSWRVWRDSLKYFWTILVVYSILVVVLVYTYQFPQIKQWLTSKNEDGTVIVEESQLERLGLRTYTASGDLLIKIFIPTLFLLVCMFQRHLFHETFIKMTENYDKDPEIDNSKTDSSHLEESHTLLNDGNHQYLVDGVVRNSSQSSLSGSSYCNKSDCESFPGENPEGYQQSDGNLVDKGFDIGAINHNNTNNNNNRRSSITSSQPSSSEQKVGQKIEKFADMLDLGADAKTRRDRRKALLEAIRDAYMLSYELMWDFLYIHSSKLTLMVVISCGIFNVNVPHAIHVIFWIIFSPLLFHFEYGTKIYHAVTLVSTVWATIMIIITLWYQMMAAEATNKDQLNSIAKECNYKINTFKNKEYYLNLIKTRRNELADSSFYAEEEKLLLDDTIDIYDVETKYQVDTKRWYGLEVIDYGQQNMYNFTVPSRYNTTISYELSWLLIVLVQMLATTVRIRAKIKINIGKAHKKEEKRQKYKIKHDHYYRSIDCLEKGMVFPEGIRQDADKDGMHMFKYLVNFVFYKFGVQICQIMTALLVIVRQDVYAVIYGFLMIITLFIEQRQNLKLFWHGYLFCCIAGLIVQYVSLLGFPDSKCQNYNEIFFTQIDFNLGDNTKNSTSISDMSKEQQIHDQMQLRAVNEFKKFKFMHWLYLPSTEITEEVYNFEKSLLIEDNKIIYNHDPTKKPTDYYMIYDAIQLIMVLCQWIVFSHEQDPKYNTNKTAGSNDDITDKLDDIDDLDLNAVPNFLKKENNNIIDYIKTAIFQFSYWITLTVLCAAGMLRTTIFSLIYLFFAFTLLSTIQKEIGKSVSNLIKGKWKKLMIYSASTLLLKAIVVMAKEILEYDINFISINTKDEKNDTLNTMLEGLNSVFQLIYRLLLGTAEQQGGTDSNSQLWDTVMLDWTCFLCLLLQRRVFSSHYFAHVIKGAFDVVCANLS